MWVKSSLPISRDFLWADLLCIVLEFWLPKYQTLWLLLCNDVLFNVDHGWNT